MAAAQIHMQWHFCSAKCSRKKENDNYINIYYKEALFLSGQFRVQKKENHVYLAVLIVTLLRGHPVVEECRVAPHKGDGQPLEETSNLL